MSDSVGRSGPLARHAFAAAGDAGIAPEVEGRICVPADAVPCLAVETP